MLSQQEYPGCGWAAGANTIEPIIILYYIIICAYADIIEILELGVVSLTNHNSGKLGILH